MPKNEMAEIISTIPSTKNAYKSHLVDMTNGRLRENTTVGRIMKIGMVAPAYASARDE